MEGGEKHKPKKHAENPKQPPRKKHTEENDRIEEKEGKERKSKYCRPYEEKFVRILSIGVWMRGPTLAQGLAGQMRGRR